MIAVVVIIWIIFKKQRNTEDDFEIYKKEQARKAEDIVYDEST